AAYLRSAVPGALAAVRRARVPAPGAAVSRRYPAGQPRPSTLLLGRQPGAAQAHGRQSRLAGAAKRTSGVLFRWPSPGRGGEPFATAPRPGTDGNLRQLGNRRHRLAPGWPPLAVLRGRRAGPG